MLDTINPIWHMATGNQGITPNTNGKFMDI